jgi:Sulfotransferase family
LRIFERLTPGGRALHPLSADTPQECTDITAQVFESLRFDTMYRIPSYQHWLDERGHAGAYRFHKRFLQHLAFESGARQWFLKCPDHVFAFEAIDAVYPDARFVFVHRDPLSVLPSVAKLTALLRRPFTRALDELEIGRQVTERWSEGARLMIERCARSRGGRGRIFHVHYEELTAKPLETVTALYDWFGLNLSSTASARMRDFVERTPHGGYGNNLYSFEEFGLKRSELQQRFADYTAYFGAGSRKPSNRRVHAWGAV